MKYESTVFRRHAVTESWRFKCSLWQSCARSESPTASSINALGPLWVCRNTRLQRKVRRVCGQGTFMYSNCWFVAQKCRYNSLGFIFSNGAPIQDLELFELVSNVKSIGRKVSLYDFASKVHLFWNPISDMALVRKHVVPLTFPNIGRRVLWPTVWPAVHLSLGPRL